MIFCGWVVGRSFAAQRNRYADQVMYGDATKVLFVGIQSQIGVGLLAR
jgi:hypothetical protein